MIEALTGAYDLDQSTTPEAVRISNESNMLSESSRGMRDARKPHCKLYVEEVSRKLSKSHKSVTQRRRGPWTQLSCQRPSLAT